MARQHPLWKWVLFRLHINVPKRKIHRSWLKKTIHNIHVPNMKQSSQQRDLQHS